MNIDRIAAVYDTLAQLVFGDQLHQASFHFFDQIPQRCHILIAGGGSGKILKALDQPDRIIEVDYIELSGSMIRQSKKHLKGNIRVNFIHADLLDHSFERQYDIIITPFVLDCFSDELLPVLVGRLHACLKTDGKWLFADFIRTNRLWQRLLVWIMYRFFKVTTGLKNDRIPDYHKAFEQAGITLVGENLFYHGMIAARLYAI